MNVLTPALLASQVLNQNQRSIQRKKRSQAIGFPAPFRRRLAMDNITEVNPVDYAGPSGDSNTLSPNPSMMMAEDAENCDEVYGQWRLSSFGDRVKQSKLFRISPNIKMLILII